MEMLFVMAILLILAAILFPVFAACRDAARGATCLSNEKQLALAFAMYEADASEVLPAAGDFGRDLGCAWVLTPVEYVLDLRGGALFPYTRETRIYHCAGDLDEKERVLSYAMNARLSKVALARVDRPSEVSLLIEEGIASGRGQGLQDAAFYWDLRNDQLAASHHGGGTLLFLDGHAQWRHSSYRE